MSLKSRRLSLGNRVSAPVAAASKLSPGTALCHGLCCPQPPPPLSSPFPDSPSSSIYCPVSDCPSACDPEARGHKLEAAWQQEGGDGGGGEEQVHGRPGQCLQSYQVSFESTKEVKNIYCLHRTTMRCTFPFSRWFSKWAVNHLRVNFNGGEKRWLLLNIPRSHLPDPLLRPWPLLGVQGKRGKSF